jgi:ATPase subunit of ABC transporter with duplicated ATPase domains
MDEPTNDLDFETIAWLENFLEPRILRYCSRMTDTFDSVCTHISDIDFSKINHYSGNYTFGMNRFSCKATQQQNKKEGKETRIRRIYSSFFCECCQVQTSNPRKKMISKLNIRR